MWLVALLLLLVLAGAFLFRGLVVDDSSSWDRESRDELRRMHADLGEAMALLRSSGHEITEADVATWLSHLDTGGYLAGRSTAMTVLERDAAAGSFLVAARSTG